MKTKPTKRAVKTIVRRKDHPVWARYIWLGGNFLQAASRAPLWKPNIPYHGSSWHERPGSQWGCIKVLKDEPTEKQRRASLRRIVSPKGRA